jgi:hypothetical protein
MHQRHLDGVTICTLSNNTCWCLLLLYITLTAAAKELLQR